MSEVPTSVVGHEDAIIALTKKFEAEHEECLRVLPYKDKGHLEVRLYVYTVETGLQSKQNLEAAAQKCFGEMGVSLEWLDLYNKASTVLNVTPVEYPSGKPNRLEANEVDEISKIISKNLHIFSNHRNITAVQPSFKVSRDLNQQFKSIQTPDPCIAVYVLGKGRIPLSESEIPQIVHDYPVDIVDGFWFEAVETWMPNEAQQQLEDLQLGASIGAEGVEASGTLGAIVEDENNRGTLYALSCDHVLKVAEKKQVEIVHPGLNDYLNYLKWTLKTYLELLRKIPGPRCLDEESVDDLQTTEELSEKFNALKMIKAEHLDLLRNEQTDPRAITFLNQQEYDRFKYYFPDGGQARKNRLSRLQQKTVSKLLECEKMFEQSLPKQPRNIAKYKTGISENVLSGDKLYFIDAAIAELNQDEVKKLKDSGRAEVVGTNNFPIGECTPATTKAIINAGKLCKSGRTTGYTTSEGLVLGSTDAPIYLKTKVTESDGVLFQVKITNYLCHSCQQERPSQSNQYTLSTPHSCDECGRDASHYEIQMASNCLCIVSEEKPFAQKGDSGSVIFEIKERGGNPPERCLSGFGLLFGVFKSAYKSCALATPLQVALDELSRKVSDTCNLKLVSSYY